MLSLSWGSKNPCLQYIPTFAPLSLSLSLTQAHWALKSVDISYIELFGSLNFVVLIEGVHAKITGRPGKQ